MPKILIVEDNPDSATMLSRLLGYHGYPCDVVHTLEDAKLAAKECAHDIIITDIRLPDGSGIELMHFARNECESRGRQLRGIGLSGLHMRDVPGANEAGFSDFFTKPILIDKLTSAISKILS